MTKKKFKASIQKNEYIKEAVRRYTVMPAISLVIVTNGPALIAGSMFAFINRIGAVEPIIERY